MRKSSPKGLDSSAQGKALGTRRSRDSFALQGQYPILESLSRVLVHLCKVSFQAAFRTVLERYEVGPVDAISLPSAALTGQRNIWDNRVPRAVPWAGEFLRLWRKPYRLQRP